jgi:hypothetical protein
MSLCKRERERERERERKKERKKETFPGYVTPSIPVMLVGKNVTV